MFGFESFHKSSQCFQSAILGKLETQRLVNPGADAIGSPLRHGMLGSFN
jgi:hypothetical protein